MSKQASVIYSSKICSHHKYNLTVLELELVAMRAGFVNEIVVILLIVYRKDGGV